MDHKQYVHQEDQEIEIDIIGLLFQCFHRHYLIRTL